GCDLRMAHQPLEGGQGHSGPHHIGSKCVATSGRISVMDLTAPPMVPEQRTKPSRTHRLAVLLAFQANEKGGCLGERTFQVQIAPENLQDFRISGGSGTKRFLFPLPWTRIWPSASCKSSSCRARTSQERKPSRSISPTSARSRKVRKLCQNLATSSAESGTMIRRSCLRQRPRATALRGRP